VCSLSTSVHGCDMRLAGGCLSRIHSACCSLWPAFLLPLKFDQKLGKCFLSSPPFGPFHRSVTWNRVTSFNIVYKPGIHAKLRHVSHISLRLLVRARTTALCTLILILFSFTHKWRKLVWTNPKLPQKLIRYNRIIYVHTPVFSLKYVKYDNIQTFAYFWMVQSQGSITKKPVNICTTPQTMQWTNQLLRRNNCKDLFNKGGSHLCVDRFGSWMVTELCGENYFLGQVSWNNQCASHRQNRKQILRAGIADSIPIHCLRLVGSSLWR